MISKVGYNVVRTAVAPRSAVYAGGCSGLDGSVIVIPLVAATGFLAENVIIGIGV